MAKESEGAASAGCRRRRSVLNCNISQRTDDELYEMEQFLETNRTDVVRLNTSLCHFLMQAQLDGKEVLLRTADGALEVVQLLGGRSPR